MTNADTQNWLLEAGIKEALTYSIKEDNAGGLHMLLYREELNIAALIGACLNIRPADIKACIEDIDNWTTWEGLVDITDYEREICAIRDQCVTVEKTQIEPLGLVRVTFWGRMGAAARQAFEHLDVDYFGGKQHAPKYALPILDSYFKYPERAKSSALVFSPYFDRKIRKLYYREGLLFSYNTLIAKIDCRGKCLYLNARKYSQTTSRIQNELVYMAESRGFNIYYCPTETVLSHL